MRYRLRFRLGGRLHALNRDVLFNVALVSWSDRLDKGLFATKQLVDIPMTQSKHITNLLLVDDDPSMVRLLAKVIDRSFGDQITVESLTDPAAARARIDDGNVDILLTDLEMPGVNGLELLRCAKRRNAYTQVLFLTGHSSQDALLDALELGATDYLLKPVDQQQLLELISQAHSRQQRWRQALAETWRRRSEPVGAECG